MINFAEQPGLPAHHGAATRFLPTRTRRVVAMMALLWLAVAASGADALEFECEAPNDKRFIHVDLPGKDHLCEVVVDYPSGANRVLWYADHDTLFCSAKAYELRDKYQNNWNFDCTVWPDLDGIDQLSARHRYILDAQLKTLMSQLAADPETGGEPAGNPADDSSADGSGNDTIGALSDDVLLADNPVAPDKANEPDTESEHVLWVKSTTSEPVNDESGTLVLQFFIGTGENTITRDITQVIVDEGRAWRIKSRIDDLQRYIESTDEQPIVSAIVTGVTDSGLLEVTTATASTPNAPHRPECEGRQFLQTRSGEPPEPASDHVLVCNPT